MTKKLLVALGILAAVGAIMMLTAFLCAAFLVFAPGEAAAAGTAAAASESAPETAAAPKKSPALEKTFNEFMAGAERVLKFSGSVLVAKDGKILFAKGYGMADLKAGKPNTPDTKFLIGSVTKQFTAAAIMQLVEKKLIALDDPFGKYVPEYPKSAADKITIRHLLTHTSGIANCTDQPKINEMKTKPAAPAEVLALVQDIPLAFEPGSEWRYSNTNYILLGLIIERVSGEAYSAYVQKHIFKPLGMRDTECPMDFLTGGGLAIGYEVDSTGAPQPAAILHGSVPHAAGAIASTVRDMEKWDRGLRGNKLLSKASLDEMFTPFKSNYAFGWGIDSLYGRRMASHGGGIDGFCSTFLRFIDEPFCVVVFINSDAACSNLSRVERSLAAIANGEPYDVPVLKTPIAVDARMLDEYVGVYEVSPGVRRIVAREGDSLFAQRTGGGRSLVRAESKDKFFYERDNTTTITFVRDAAGAVIAHILHQNGRDATARRLSEAEAKPILEAQKAVAVDAALFEKYSGEYEVGPGFVIAFRTRDGRFFTQAAGQDEFEIFPRSATEFFLKVVDGSVTFVMDSTGAVGGIVLHQGGRDIPAKKIK